MVEKPKSGKKLTSIQAVLIAFFFLLVGAYFGRGKVAAEPEPKAEQVNPFAANAGGCTKPKEGEKPACDKKKDL
mgnify:CR=1 FL=1